MGWLQRVVTLIALAAVAVTFAPTDRAWACSCAEPTIEEVLEREPDAAVVRIRRIDPDGGTSGVGHVEEVLHGPPLPEQLPLALDDGGSCSPWVAVGDVAVLAFVPDGDGWRTLECGHMDPTTGVAPVEADPSASGPASVVVAGRFPGAELLTLDDHLRVLATGTLDGIRHGMQRCGDGLLVPTGGPNGETSLVLMDLADLAVIDEQLLSADPESEVQVVDASCAAGRVDVLAATWGATREIQVRRDVFGDGRQIELPSAEDAAFVGEDVLLLRETPSGTGAELARHDLASDTSRTLITLDAVTGYEVSIAPDTHHALIRGFDEEPLLVVVDLTAQREVARSTGWWQPVDQPWLSADQILQLDENAGGIGDTTGLAEYRVIDLDLSTIATLEPTPAWITAADDDTILQVDGGSLTITDGAGDRLRSTTQPWTAGVHDALLLGTVTPAPEMPAADLPTVDPTVARAARTVSVSATASTVAARLGPAIGLTSALLVLVTAFLLRRRNHEHDQPPID